MAFQAFLLIFLLLSQRTVAEEYTVGGDEGWSTGQNYLTWSQQYNFSVSDVLLFKYVKGQHNVNVVTETTYRSCDSRSGVGIISTFTSGNDRVNLSQPAEYWFICSTKGHCKGGMKFVISVAAAREGGSTPPPAAVMEAPPPPPPSVVVPTGNGAVVGCSSWWVGCCLALCGLLYRVYRY